MKLNIQRLWQRDPRWEAQRLGTVNGTTIGSHGCVVTCVAMMLNYYGKSITPAEVDDYLTDNKLYFDGNLFVDSSISQLYVAMKHDKTIYCPTVSAPMSEIKSYLDAKKPVFVWVMNGKIKHCTLAIGYEGDQIIVNDPWMGDTVNIKDRWGDSAEQILQVNYFLGPLVYSNIDENIIYDTESQTKIKELEAERDKLNKVIEKKDKEIKELQDNLHVMTARVNEGINLSQSLNKRIQELEEQGIQAGTELAEQDITIAQQKLHISTLEERLTNGSNAIDRALEPYKGWANQVTAEASLIPWYLRVYKSVRRTLQVINMRP